MKVYYYPTCNTCKKAMKWLDEKGIPYSKKHIVDSNLTYKEVEEIYKKSKLDVQKLFNTSGLVYRELNLKDKLRITSIKWDATKKTSISSRIDGYCWV